jgi:hypothetical protein
MTQLGHRTRAMFDRCNIVSDADLPRAQDLLGVYLDAIPKRSRKQQMCPFWPLSVPKRALL